MSTPQGLPSLLLAKGISFLKSTWSRISLAMTSASSSKSPVSELVSPGGSPQLFRPGQDKECGHSGFSLINSQLGVLEGWGSREVTWDMGGHERQKED